MPESAVMDALAAVDEGGQTEAPTDTLDESGGLDAPDRDGEGEMPALDEGEEEEAGGLLDFDLREWLARVPEGSHTDFDASHWWDTETGGRRRLAFHLSDAAGSGAGYPNGLGVLVGALEEYFSLVEKRQTGDSDGDSPDSDSGEEGDLY